MERVQNVKILVVGSGGREHALAWKFAQSENVSVVYVVFDYAKNQKNKMDSTDRYIKRLQRKMARQKLTSNRRRMDE